MTYWLVLNTFFWAMTFGNYASEAECLRAAKEAPRSVSASCIVQPKPVEQHTHCGQTP